MAANGRKYSKTITHGRRWSRMVANGRKQSQMVANGKTIANRCKLSQTVANGRQRSQIVANGCKKSQMVANVLNVVRKSLKSTSNCRPSIVTGHSCSSFVYNCQHDFLYENYPSGMLHLRFTLVQ